MTNGLNYGIIVYMFNFYGGLMKKIFAAILGFSLMITPVSAKADVGEYVAKGCFYVVGPAIAAVGAFLTVKSLGAMTKEACR